MFVQHRSIEMMTTDTKKKSWHLLPTGMKNRVRAAPGVGVPCDLAAPPSPLPSCQRRAALPCERRLPASPAGRCLQQGKQHPVLLSRLPPCRWAGTICSCAAGPAHSRPGSTPPLPPQQCRCPSQRQGLPLTLPPSHPPTCPRRRALLQFRVRQTPAGAVPVQSAASLQAAGLPLEAAAAAAQLAPVAEARIGGREERPQRLRSATLLRRPGEGMARAAELMRQSGGGQQQPAGAGLSSALRRAFAPCLQAACPAPNCCQHSTPVGRCRGAQPCFC
jgi:hypothetical protein